jgi:uncharacterized Zn-finger protein
MEPAEIIKINDRSLHCDGGGKPLGHPRIFLNMGEADYIDCPYCGKRYQYEEKNDK